MKRYGSIYKITNTLSGKSYIGQTTQPVKKRFRQHISDSRSGKHLFFSIQKYGFNNFSFEEILTCFDGKSLNVAETYFIKYFNTFGEHGYNLTMGGEEKGQITEEVRKKCL
jgi:group I intron endonuclease